MRRSTVVGLALALTSVGLGPQGSAAGCGIPASPASAPQWPPAPEPGTFDVVHFGEGHYNEGQGPLTMPILVQEVVSHSPDFVAFSSDMADIGTADKLTCFRSIMQPLVDAGIPWYDSPGNHDRLAIGPGGVVNTEIGPYREVFAGMPAPWGDAPPPPGFVVPSGEPDDGAGASTHYYLDYGPPGTPVMRLIVLDNSRHSFTGSDVDQYPSVGPLSRDASQLAFLLRTSQDARDKGLLTFVMMHQPTQDPRDITNAHPTSYNHTMSKGLSADNALFDLIALATGVDGVLLGHIQGNVAYRFGDVKYFVDGGGGGSPYAMREVGTDTGYLYGFRIIRVVPGGYRTYLIPLVDHIELAAPAGPVTAGDEVALSATALQPFDPTLPGRFGLLPNFQIELDLRPPDPARIDAATVPHLAYMWSTSDPSVLKPVSDAAHDPAGDPAFDENTMTMSGRFLAAGPGQATITVATGTHSASATITVS